MSKKADEHFTPTGLSSSYALVLLSVNDSKGISPGQIAEEIQLTPSTVTRFLDKMEMKGLIERVQCGRASQVLITEKGRALIPQVKKAWKALYEDYTSTIGEKETAELTGCINEAMLKLQ